MITPSFTGATSNEYFASLAEKILAQGVLDGSNAWRQAMTSKIEKTWQYFYNSRSTMEGDIRRLPNEHPNDYRNKPKQTIALVDRAVQQYISNVYGLPALRTVPNYPEFESEIKKFNMGLPDRGNRYTKLQTTTEIAGTAAAVPRVRNNGSLDFDIFSMEQIYPTLDTLTGELIGLALETIIDTTLRPIVREEAWTADGWQVWEDGKLIEEGSNPYGRIPAVVFRAEDGGQFWWGLSRAMKLVEPNRDINEMLTDLATLQRDQTSSLLVITGVDGELGEDIIATIGVNRYATIPDGTDAKYLTPDVPLDSIKNMIMFRIDQALKDGAIVEVVKEGKTPESGFGMSIRKLPEEAVMSRKREAYADADAALQEMAMLVKSVADTGSPKRLADDFKVKTVFDTSTLIPTSADEKQKEAFATSELIKNNILSPIDEIQKRFKLSRDEAIKRYNENRDINGNLGA